MDCTGYKFPLFLDLNGKKAVVVGGGKIALRRAGVLCHPAQRRIAAKDARALQALPYIAGLHRPEFHAPFPLPALTAIL